MMGDDSSSLTRELLCPLLVEIGSIARSRLAGISSRYAEIRRRGKRANLNKETANEFSRRAARSCQQRLAVTGPVGCGVDQQLRHSSSGEQGLFVLGDLIVQQRAVEHHHQRIGKQLGRDDA